MITYPFLVVSLQSIISSILGKVNEKVINDSLKSTLAFSTTFLSYNKESEHVTNRDP